MRRATRNRKHILHVTTVPMSLRFLKGQVGYVKNHGYEVSVASSPGAELNDFGVLESVEVFPVEMERRIAPLKDLVSLARLWWTMRAVKPEIVHSHTPKGGLLGMCAATLAGVPVRTYHLRGLPMMTAQGPKRELLRWSERLSCRLADDVYCVSASLRETAITEKLCKPAKIRVLANGSGNGVDSQGQYRPSANGTKRQEMRQLLDIPRDSLVVGFVGRLVRDKGVSELWEAWQRIRKRFPEGYLLLVGPREAADVVPEDIVRSFEADPRVRMVGLVENAAPYYSTMDLLALPTYREGFPNVLLEAAAMELPVVATRVTGCMDAVVDGETGRLVPPQDTAALTTACIEYLESESLRKSHGVSARRRVCTEFSQERIWEELTSRYDELRGSV